MISPLKIRTCSNYIFCGLLLLTCLGSVRRAAADVSSVTVVGAYSNMVITDVHAQGYSVELWQDGARYFGFLLTAAGLAEDTPTGILDDLSYDPATRELKFKAKMSTGRSTMDGEHWVPSRDLFQFEGTLFPDQISGTLIHADALTPDRVGQAEEVKLYRTKDEEAAMTRPATYDQWEEMARQVLEARGPKW